MPLVQNVLNKSLEEAFNRAMFVFAETISNNPPGKDVSDLARKAAAKTFSSIATPAIDAYIKSASITIPPGQTVSAPPPSGIGITTSPSPLANIL